MSTAVGEPVTPRGRRTRAQLVDAASQVFAEKRFLDTNIADIVARAGVAHGTFYRYFDSKEQVFREVALDLQQRLLRSDADEGAEHEMPAFASPSAELHWRITRANRRYLTAYRENSALMAVIEQVATFNDELLAIRREIRTAFVERAQRTIERMQSLGLAHRDIDSRYAASALGSMVDRFGYVAFVIEEPFELEESARTLSLLWARALGLDVPVGPPVDAAGPRRRQARAEQRPRDQPMGARGNGPTACS
jgi:AcrR family transcriptional regulator